MRTKGDDAIIQTALKILRRETATGATCWPQDSNGLSPLLSALQLEYAAQDREHSGAIFLDGQCRLLGCECIGVGTTDNVPIYMRDLVRAALNVNANGLILWHTHPGGDKQPSKQDMVATVQSVNFLERLGIHVHDHFVIATTGWTSIRDTMKALKKERQS